MDDLYFSLYKWQFYEYYLLHSTFEYEHGVVLDIRSKLFTFLKWEICLLFLSILETSVSEGNMQAVGATQKEANIGKT